jgi:hypothetical protein
MRRWARRCATGPQPVGTRGFRLVRNRAATASAVIIALFVAVALFAQRLAPHNPLNPRQQHYLPADWVEHSATGKSERPSTCWAPMPSAATC